MTDIYDQAPYGGPGPRQQQARAYAATYTGNDRYLQKMHRLCIGTHWHPSREQARIILAKRDRQAHPVR